MSPFEASSITEERPSDRNFDLTPVSIDVINMTTVVSVSHFFIMVFITKYPRADKG